MIIEDEKNAQEILTHYISKKTTLSCTGIYETGSDVPSEKIYEVDFMFLDMELPELNGLEFLKSIENPPKVIVTTAYPNYAVDAFEQAVVDYLVKPFSYERFEIAVDRITINKEIDHDKYILVYADKTTHKVKVNDIKYIKSELDYVLIVTKEERILLLGSLSNWMKKMSPFSFVRIHRSYIVNTKWINKVKSKHIEIENIDLPLGNVYKNNFKEKYLNEDNL